MNETLLKLINEDVADMTREERLAAAADIITAACKKYKVDIEDFSYGAGDDLRVTITHNHTTESKPLNLDFYGFDTASSVTPHTPLLTVFIISLFYTR